MPTNEQDRLDGWLSVTQVLDSYREQGLVDWQVRVGKKEAKRIGTIAKKTGHRVHQLIEADWLKSGAYKLNTKDSIEVRNCMKAWEQFKKDYSPQIVSMEEEVKDDVLKVVGHLDMIANIGNQIVLIDLKTSSQINSKHWLQVNKYADMAEISKIVGVLRLDKNLGIYEYQQKSFDKSLVNIFDSMVAVYRYFNPHGVNEETANGNDSADDNSTDRGF